MPWINVDFWEILTHDDAPFDFMALADDLHGRRFPQRSRDRGEDHLDLIEVLDLRHRQAFGLAARVRKTNLPGQFNWRTGARRALALAEDEGLDEGSFFLYDAPTQTLAVQRQQIFRASALEKLLHELTGAPIFFNPRLRQDKWQRFDRMDHLGSFELKLRGPAHHPNFTGRTEALGRLLDESQEEVNAHTVELKMSMGRSRKQSLDVPWVKRVVRAFRTAGRMENVESLKVTGKRGDAQGRQEVIDLLRDRLVFSEQLEYAGRTLEPERCQDILRRAIENHRGYLRTLV